MPCSQAHGGFPGIGDERVREGQPLCPPAHHCRPSPMHPQHQAPSAATESGPHCSFPHDLQRPCLLNEVWHLADFVANKKYQFPGVSQPPCFATPEVPHGALGHLLKGTVQGQMETILQNAKAVSFLGPQPLAMPPSPPTSGQHAERWKPLEDTTTTTSYQ